MAHLPCPILHGRVILFLRSNTKWSPPKLVTGANWIIPRLTRSGPLTGMISGVLGGRRPELPLDLPLVVRNIIAGCWHSDPLERPSFLDICMMLKHNRSPNPISVVIDSESKEDTTVVKRTSFNYCMLTLSLTCFGTDFEVTDHRGRKIQDEELIGNMRKVLSLPVKMKWITNSLGRSIDANTTAQLHIVELIGTEVCGVLADVSAILARMNWRVHTAGCWIRKGRVACVMSVEGAKMDGLLWELYDNMRIFFGGSYNYKMIVCKVATHDFIDFKRWLRNLMVRGFEVPQSASNIHIHQERKERRDGEGWGGIANVMCLNRPKLLFNVSCTLADLNYKIMRASIHYPGPYVFLRGRTRMREDIDITTLGDEERGIIEIIVEDAIERRCPEGSIRLTVTGEREGFFDALEESLRENGL